MSYREERDMMNGKLIPQGSLAALVALSSALVLGAAERPVDPTFLHRRVQDVREVTSDVTTPSCRYKPLFGAGDAGSSIVKGVARFGVMSVDPGGRSALVNYPAEEQIYFVLEGKGSVSYEGSKTPIKKNDVMYFAPGKKHGVANASQEPLRVVVMGYKIPEGTRIQAPSKLPIANADQAKKQVVGGHPPSTRYQLLMGGLDSKRDLLATGHVLTSLFLMEFDAGGTNHPHHHIKEEEIYLLLEEHGDMVAGGGMTGVEGRHPSTPGDAYFYRLNCTVGFYAAPELGAKKAKILAVRSLYPGMKK
jgi:mannose-6-phosphate isomerase-like protein (cupin superfamily)